MSAAPPDAEAVLAFWFGAAARDPAAALARVDVWFGVDAAFDAEIRTRFAGLVDAASRGDPAAWEASARGMLALVILLDQFPRNLFRGEARAFATDALALAHARRALAAAPERALTPIEQVFLLLPLEHAESIAAQDECVARAEALAATCAPAWRETIRAFVPFTHQHRAVIEAFGRFPHRNRALGRASTPAEERYLADGAETYGQR